MAADQLRKTVDQLQAALKSPELKEEAKGKERRQKLREIIYPRFDFAEMAKRSLGPHWRRLSPKEQREFVQLFSGLLEEAYLDKIESYNGEKVLYLNQKQDMDLAQVDTRIAGDKGKEFSLNYRLHQVHGDWKVYDVVVENISLVNNYRSQFSRLLEKSSYQELLVTLRQKRFSAPGSES
jgi:phospholipid transport system substrate-binding protein